MSFKYTQLKPFSEKTAQLEKALDYLNGLSALEKITTDQSSYEAVFCIYELIAIIPDDKIDYDMFIKKKAYDLLANMMMFLYKIIDNLDFDSIGSVERDFPANNASEKLKGISAFSYNIYSLNNLSKRRDFCPFFQKTDGLKAYMLFLSHPKIITVNVNRKHNTGSRLAIIDSMCLTLSLLSYDCQDFVLTWRELNTIQVLLNATKQKDSAKTYAYKVILMVADDKQIESMLEVQTFASSLVKIIKKMADNVRGQTGKEITSVENEFGIQTSLNTNLKALFKLTINDKLREKIYFELDFKNDIQALLTNGDNLDKKQVLDVVAQLTFNKKISNDMKSNNTLNNILDELKNKTNDLKTRIENINWNYKMSSNDDGSTITQNTTESAPNSVNTSSETSGSSNSNSLDQKHIMISYNTSSRELCLKIKTRLESLGYKVWIDVDNIHSSSIEAMANAVEKSFCVLMCVTEKYRESVNCQSEAQYAFRIKKPIIPLIMQPGYENVSGWLGFIIGDKIFVNFTKYDFEECIRKLKNEVAAQAQAFISFNSTSSSTISANPVLHQPVKQQAESMGQSETQEWFRTSNIDPIIVNYLSTCDGLVLKQLYDLKHSNKQFYDQSLSTIPNITLLAVITFSAALEKLFS